MVYSQPKIKRILCFISQCWRDVVCTSIMRACQFLRAFLKNDFTPPKEEILPTNSPDCSIILNYINFQDGTILLTFKHSKYDKVISFDVRPMRIIENSLDCEWLETTLPVVNLASYQFQYLLISDGLKL